MPLSLNVLPSSYVPLFSMALLSPSLSLPVFLSPPIFFLPIIPLPSCPFLFLHPSPSVPPSSCILFSHVHPFFSLYSSVPPFSPSLSRSLSISLPLPMALFSTVSFSPCALPSPFTPFLFRLTKNVLPNSSPPILYKYSAVTSRLMHPPIC